MHALIPTKLGVFFMKIPIEEEQSLLFPMPEEETA